MLRCKFSLAAMLLPLLGKRVKQFQEASSCSTSLHGYCRHALLFDLEANAMLTEGHGCERLAARTMGALLLLEADALVANSVSTAKPMRRLFGQKWAKSCSLSSAASTVMASSGVAYLLRDFVRCANGSRAPVSAKALFQDFWSKCASFALCRTLSQSSLATSPSTATPRSAAYILRSHALKLKKP